METVVLCVHTGVCVAGELVWALWPEFLFVCSLVFEIASLTESGAQLLG